MLIITLFVLFGFIGIIYFGYSLLCWFFVRKGNTHKKSVIFPSVTLLVCAYNEEEIIRKKIENIIKIVYPKEKLNILFVNDNSSDKTRSIIQENLSQIPFFSEVIDNGNSRGKVNALNFVFPLLKDEITVLTDADSLLEPDSISNLVKNFANMNVGGVSGTVKILSTEKEMSVEHETLYRKFFDLWRRGESAIHSISISNGPIMGVWTSLLKEQKLSSNADDTEILFNVISKNKRFVYEPDAIAYECTPTDISERFNQKMRRAKGVFQVYTRNFSMLGNGRFGKLVFPFVFLQICVIPYLFFVGVLLFFWLAVLNPLWFFGLSLFVIPKIRSIFKNIIYTQLQLALSPFYRTGAWKTMKSSRKTLGQLELENQGGHSKRE